MDPTRLNRKWSPAELAIVEAMCLDENAQRAVRAHKRAQQFGLPEAYGAAIFDAMKRPFAFYLEDVDADPARTKEIVDAAAKILAAQVDALKEVELQQRAAKPEPPKIHADEEQVRQPPAVPVPPPGGPAEQIARPHKGRYDADGGPDWEYLKTRRNADLVWDRLHFSDQASMNRVKAAQSLRDNGYAGDLTVLRLNANRQDLPQDAPPEFLAFVRGLNDAQWGQLAYSVGRATGTGRVIMKDREGRQ